MIREITLICSSIIVIIILTLFLHLVFNSPKQIDPPDFVKKTQYIDRLTRLNNKYLKDLPFSDKICTRYCKQGVCDDYQVQLNKYNECKNNSQNQELCAEQYGCFDETTDTWTSPFNPGKNECKVCRNV